MRIQLMPVSFKVRDLTSIDFEISNQNNQMLLISLQLQSFTKYIEAILRNRLKQCFVERLFADLVQCSTTFAKF